MSQSVNCIMLIDDNKHDNYFHERIIKEYNSNITVITQPSGTLALQYLQQQHEEYNRPDIIFLDINMPRMNGWEFLEEYKKLNKELHSKVIVVMLTTSLDSQDKDKSEAFTILSDYNTKPLTQSMVESIVQKYFV
ncbi:response regulator [soil metagenome]